MSATLSAGFPPMPPTPPTAHQVQDVEVHRELGVLDARQKGIEDLVRRQTEDIAAIRRTLDEARGGAVILRWIVGPSLLAIIAGLATLWAWVHAAPTPK